MKRLILPLLLLIIGVGAGVGAGLYFQSPPEETDLATDDTCNDPETSLEQVKTQAEISEEREYAKLNNQFIVPVVKEGQVVAMVVLSLSLEVTLGGRTAVFATEPKLRDVFLQAMFDHANAGGFSGNFTSGENMHSLRTDLLRRARTVAGEQVTDVLITDIVRQDS